MKKPDSVESGFFVSLNINRVTILRNFVLIKLLLILKDNRSLWGVRL